MRPSHIINHIEQQYVLSNIIRNTYDNFALNSSNDVTNAQINARLSILKEDWERFSIEHKAITIAVDSLSDENKHELKHHSYFSNQLFYLTHGYYVSVVDKFTALLKPVIEDNVVPLPGPDRGSKPRVESVRSSTSTSSEIPIFVDKARLPRINIPSFGGVSADWLSFKNLFTSIVISNPSLTPVEKLQYLKTSLTGSAASLLKNTALTSENFQTAWDDLISFYENKRLLVNTALTSLFALQRIPKESAASLEKLYIRVREIYRTLESLQQPVEKWDAILIFTVVQRLDSDSVKAWEQHLGSSRSLPTWRQFNEFLTSHMLSLQAYEGSHKGRVTAQTGQSSARVHLTGKSSSVTSSITQSCPLCKNKHYVSSCPLYCDKTVQQRLDLIKKHKLCYNCLGHHKSIHCKKTSRCQKCGSKHHTTLHRNNTSKQNETATDKTVNVENTSNQTKQDVSKAQVLHSKSNSIVCSGNVLLATARVRILASKGDVLNVRTLVDPGSEISFISERLVQRMRLPRSHSHISLYGIGAQKSATTRGFTSITLAPHYESDFRCTFKTHILKTLTTSLPSMEIHPDTWMHLNRLNLADPSFYRPDAVDLIIGADVYSQIIEEGVIKGSINTPVAQCTKIGWIVSGSVGSEAKGTIAYGYHVSTDNDLHNLLKQFWTLEEVPSTTQHRLSPDEEVCESHFKASHSRDAEGRYIVELPFKRSADNLGESRHKALRLVTKLAHRLIDNPAYAQAYMNFIEEYENLKHMREITDDLQTPPPVYYLPHHGVWRENSLTTKLRVVFNGSSPTTNGVSLNDLLHIGPKLQTDLLDVLIRFRLYCYVFSTDVEKMFRQIKVHPKHWKFQRIFWIDNTNGLHTYELTTVTYGLACAPYLALRVFLQLIKDEGSKYPLAIPILTNGRYVDDIFGGADTIEQLKEIAQQLTELCKAGGFALQKWISNDPKILQDISLDKHLESIAVTIDDNLRIKTLGLSWQPQTDTLQFTFQIPNMNVFTKRTLLSIIARFFDPLGLLAPILISLKVLIQELWSLKLNWDDPLPDVIKTKWTSLVASLEEIQEFKIPRWIGYKTHYQTELHGFCDASQKAIAAVVYLRTTNENGEIVTSLLVSKTKVAPLKRLTIPRLELSGAYLLTKLVSHVIDVLEIKSLPVYMWTDSSITYTWLNNHPARWKEYVHNRVSFIQDSLPQASWRFVPGNQNPADLATRGITPKQLQETPIWWTAPPWLSKPSSEWPKTSDLPAREALLEERKSSVHVNTKPPNLWNLIYKYSDLNRLIRITAYCIRAARKFKKQPILNGILTTTELEGAKLFWIKEIQRAYFQPEIDTLRRKGNLPTSNSLLRLTPFLDSDGLLRLGGRLQRSLLPSSERHPLILPKSSPLTTMIISDAHTRTLHGGTQVTLSYIRTHYWIIGGRSPVRSFILKCVRCARFRQKRAQQLMGQLPIERVTPSRPFTHSGVDYAGPFTLKTWRGKLAKSYKAYIILFVCYSTSAVHLELATDYTAEGFIAAFTRFTARRGICTTLSSDCGTNLKGAETELKTLFTAATLESDKLATLLAKDGTQWRFNPPSAPHFGGKWESSVKSVKFHLKRIIGDTSLTYEEFSTLLTQIEAVLNSRPLCALTEDPEDLSVLTPGHFLMGCAPTTIPEPSLQEVKTSRLSRWQMIQQMLECFWNRWSKECMQRHYAIYKWNKTHPSITVGSLVLVIDERYPPSKWPLGRVLETHPGKDNLTRVVTIRTQSSILKRPIVKVCPLPIDTDTL